MFNLNMTRSTRFFIGLCVFYILSLGWIIFDKNVWSIIFASIGTVSYLFFNIYWFIKDEQKRKL